jgi:signal transduction histidine kinase
MRKWGSGSLGKARPSRLRTIRIYLLGILVCTFLFFSSSLVSLVRQKDSAMAFPASILRAEGERIAAGLDIGVQRLAADVLSPANMAALRSIPGAEPLTDKTRGLRDKLNSLKKRYPAMQHLMVLNAGRLVYPAIASSDAANKSSDRQQPDAGGGDEAALAKALAAQSSARQLPGQSGIIEKTVRWDEQALQIFSRTSAEQDGPVYTLAFSISRKSIQDTFLRELAPKDEAEKLIRITLEETAGEEWFSDNSAGLDLDLSAVLKPWKLRLSHPSGPEAEAAIRREMVFLVLSVIMFFSVLGLGVYLLVAVSQDMHWYQVRSDFVSGVSHELKTPLSLIRLYSETLADSEHEFSEADRSKYLRIIAKESERLSRLIDNVLSFSQIDRGEKRRDIKEGDLAKTVSQTAENYAEYLVLRGFTVKTGFQPDLPPVCFSPEQVSQVILNLMDNARKYSGESRLIRVHMWKDGNEVVVEVQDFGLGIPAEERGKIFEPFYRTAVATEKGGCGLGLFLVQEVMKDHGGRIEVESEVGKGSRFRLRFPVANTAANNIKISKTGRSAVAN